MTGAASQAGDADFSRASSLTSGLQGSVNVHRGALLLVPQWQCISSFVFYIGNFTKWKPIITRGPKGHISCTWVQCATFLRNQPRRTFLFTDRPEKLSRGHWDFASCQVLLNSVLLPVKFLWIPFSGFRGEVENVSANQRLGRPS